MNRPTARALGAAVLAIALPAAPGFGQTPAPLPVALDSISLICGGGIVFSETTITIDSAGAVTSTTRDFNGTIGPTVVGHDLEASRRFNQLLDQANFESMFPEPQASEIYCRLGRTRGGRTFELDLPVGGFPPPDGVLTVVEDLDELGGAHIVPPGW